MRKFAFDFTRMTGDDFRKVMAQKMGMIEYMRMMERIIGPEIENLTMEQFGQIGPQFTAAMTEYIAELMDRVHDTEVRSLLSDVKMDGTP